MRRCGKVERGGGAVSRQQLATVFISCLLPEPVAEFHKSPPQISGAEHCNYSWTRQSIFNNEKQLKTQINLFVYSFSFSAGSHVGCWHNSKHIKCIEYLTV